MNKQTVFFLCMVFMFGFSCQNVQKPLPPENLISKSVMANILTDAYLANASRNVSQKASKEKIMPLDSMIYAKYEIDSLQFVKSHTYYTSVLEDYKTILEKVDAKLMEQQKSVDSMVVILEFEEELALCDTLALDSIKGVKKEILKPKSNILKSKTSILKPFGIGTSQDSIK